MEERTNCYALQTIPFGLVSLPMKQSFKYGFNIVILLNASDILLIPDGFPKGRTLEII